MTPIQDLQIRKQLEVAEAIIKKQQATITQSNKDFDELYHMAHELSVASGILEAKLLFTKTQNKLLKQYNRGYIITLSVSLLLNIYAVIRLLVG